LAGGNFDAALDLVDSMRAAWPGNARLAVLWARLVQLQERPTHDLAEAKAALHDAIAFDKGSAAAAIELGYFLDNVEDDPREASKAFADAVAFARQQLLDGLIGQAKALRQLPKQAEFLHCVEEILHLARFEQRRKGTKKSSAADVYVKSPKGNVQFAVQFKGPHAEDIEELLGELVTSAPLVASR
jgi:tetratricopeptide (TPR) repeat protein